MSVPSFPAAAVMRRVLVLPGVLAASGKAWHPGREDRGACAPGVETKWLSLVGGVLGTMRRVVTIDGPAGAGKSTVARSLAERLRWRLLDTGAMYRAVTLAALRAGVDLESDEALGALAGQVVVRLPPGRVLLDGEDITALVRGVEVTEASRYLADSPSVRRQLVAWQRAFADEYDVIAEGRDQGTVVFPGAFRKFFLKASLDERARRRHAEFAARGEPISRETVQGDMERRDMRDAARAIAPMKPADDACVIDTTGLALDDVIARIERDVRNLLGLATDVPADVNAYGATDATAASETTELGRAEGRAGA
jgi:cytidylate kinase